MLSIGILPAEQFFEKESSTLISSEDLICYIVMMLAELLFVSLKLFLGSLFFIIVSKPLISIFDCCSE